MRLTWDYTPEGGIASPKSNEVLQEINGWTISDRKLVCGYQGIEGRWLNRLRLLDLLRHFSQARRESREEA